MAVRVFEDDRRIPHNGIRTILTVVLRDESQFVARRYMQAGNLILRWSIVTGTNFRPSVHRPYLLLIQQDSYKATGLIFRAGVFADDARRAHHALRRDDECP